MAKKSQSRRAELEQRVQALKSLSVQFVSYMIEEGFKGQTLDKIVASFTRHQAKIISGVLGGAGLAGGAWAAVSLWTGSLGAWSGLAYTLGFLSMPAWVPLAGGVAGLTAAGGAVYGVLTLAKSRGKLRHVQSIVGFSKVLIGRDTFVEEDDRLMRRFLKAQDIKADRAEELLKTTPQTAKQLARKHLSKDDRAEVARYIFPLVYAGDGVISDAERRRFARICRELELEEGSAARISKEYRTRLDRQWEYLQNLVRQLNYFADFMVFDGQEMELLREQLHQLSGFDPRRTGPAKRQKTVDMLGNGDGRTAPLTEDDVLLEAGAMGAYALAQTARRSGSPRTSDRSLQFAHRQSDRHFRRLQENPDRQPQESGQALRGHPRTAGQEPVHQLTLPRPGRRCDRYQHTFEPAATSFSGLSTTSEPAPSSATSIIPWDSTPRSLAGFRLATTTTFRPTRSAGA